MESKAVNTGSENTSSSATSVMQHGMAMRLSADSRARAEEQKQRPLVNLTCYHCDQKSQGMDEHGRPYLRCLLLSAPVNPLACGREWAGCEE